MYSNCETRGFKVRDDGLRHCEWCGSIHPEDLYNLLVENKIVLGGSDWKYGYPHKFYAYVRNKDLKLNGGKFYTNHLVSELLDEDMFNKVISTINKFSGITFERKEEKLYYTAPYPGFQKMAMS